MAKLPLRKPRLNNMALGHLRRDQVYEAVMTDLVLMGAIDKDVVEKFTGVQFADYLKPPEGFVLDGDAATDEDDVGDEDTDEDTDDIQ